MTDKTKMTLIFIWWVFCGYILGWIGAMAFYKIPIPHL